MSLPAARVSDMVVCPAFTGLVPHVGGPILPPAAITVLIGGMPAARIGDMNTCAGGPGAVAYATSKGAVMTMTRGLAKELGPDIRVNCISPGMVRTEAYAAMPDDAREAMYESTGASLPVGRVGEAQEIAQAVLAILSNGYLTGQIIDIDGGHMIRQYATRS